jgi:hypothetical protein
MCNSLPIEKHTTNSTDGIRIALSAAYLTTHNEHHSRGSFMLGSLEHDKNVSRR